MSLNPVSKLVLVLIFLLNVSCQSFVGKAAESIKTEKKTEIWAQFEQSFFNDLWSLYPGWASALGLRDYDSQLRAPNQFFFEEQKVFLNKYMSFLGQILPSALTVNEQVDYRLIKNFLESTLWELNEFKSFQWDPSRYNVGSSLAVVYESKASEAYKKENLISRLKNVPDFYKAAYLNIDKPTKEHLSLAVQQNKGTLLYLENTIKPFLFPNTKEKNKESTGDKTQKEKITTSNGSASDVKVIDDAQKSIRQFLTNLENLDLKMKKNNSYKSFRIGAAKYKRKFQLDLQVNATPDEVYNHALSEKEKALKEMIRLSEDLWTKYFPKQSKPKSKIKMVRSLVNHLSQDHVKPEEFLDAVKKQIPELWSFVQKKKLISLDSSKLLQVRTTPEYEQGFAVASIDAPGPFDPEKDTFYNVIPLEKMTKERAESFLREYNRYTLQILNIHEAIPGHYVQLVYSKKTPSLVKTIFGNGTMVEGWAVYTERMMLENGYGNNEPELWLMYYKWYLRVVSNTILDYEIHNKNISKKQGLKLLIEDAFQEKTEAEMKWERATYSQVQLASYFSGFSEIYRFREQLKSQGSFDLKKFHESFLNYGSAPIRDIITLMTSPIGAVNP